MYYEINVCYNGEHMFATHQRSIRSRAELCRVYEQFQVKFPESEGYRMDITQWVETGKPILPSYLKPE